MASPTAVNSQITDSVTPDPEAQSTSSDEAARPEDADKAAEDDESGEQS